MIHISFLLERSVGFHVHDEPEACAIGEVDHPGEWRRAGRRAGRQCFRDVDAERPQCGRASAGRRECGARLGRDDGVVPVLSARRPGARANRARDLHQPREHALVGRAALVDGYAVAVTITVTVRCMLRLRCARRRR